MKKLILLIILIGAAYYGYNNWIPFETPPNKNDMVIEGTFNRSNEWYTYKNDSYANYSIQYPSDWNVITAEDETIFTSSDKLDNVIIALKKNTTTTSGGIQTIKEVAGQQALIIEGQDPDDGSPAKFIIFNLSNNQKLEARGFGSIFNKMINTLTLDSKQPQAEEETISDAVKKEEPTEELDLIEEEQKETTPIEPEKVAINNESDEFIIKIFYQKNPGDNCSSTIGVIKEIDTRYNTDEVNALVTLTQNLSSDDINAGYTTSIPYGTRLRSLDIKNGIATADFNATLNEGGGSCSMASRRAQITETLMQFPDIEQVVITVDGDANTALQP